MQFFGQIGNGLLQIQLLPQTFFDFRGELLAVVLQFGDFLVFSQALGGTYNSL